MNPAVTTSANPLELTLEDVRRAVRGTPTTALADVRPTGVSVDSRTVAEGEVFVALRGANHDGHDHVSEALAAGACAAVVAADWTPPEPLAADADRPLIVVKDTLTALGRIAAEHRVACSAARAVAITGSCGKTTVKRMLAALLEPEAETVAAERSFNNRVGVPLTLLRLRTTTQYLVAEVGANAPGEVGDLAGLVRPEVAVLTGIGPAHLEGFGDEAGVARAKGELLDVTAADRGGVAVLNADDPWTAHYRRLHGAGDDGDAPDGDAPDGDRRPLRILTFGLGEEADLRAVDVTADAEGSTFRLTGGGDVRLAMPGTHNIRNALAALLAARRLAGLEPAEVAHRLADVQPEAGRLAPTTVAGRTVLDDSWNANPASLAAALEVLERHGADRSGRVLVMGPMAELGDRTEDLHREAGTAAAAVCARVIGAGPGIEPLLEAAAAAGAEVEHAADAAAAGRAAAAASAPGHAILVKGSRSAGMERAVRALRDAAGDAADTAGPDD